MKEHPEFNEYATCYRCGFKKYCKLDVKNFNGLKAKGLTRGS